MGKGAEMLGTLALFLTSTGNPRVFPGEGDTGLWLETGAFFQDLSITLCSMDCFESVKTEFCQAALLRL